MNLPLSFAAKSEQSFPAAIHLGLKIVKQTPIWYYDDVWFLDRASESQPTCSYPLSSALNQISLA
jgi:predicted amidohydrolase YtcJ